MTSVQREKKNNKSSNKRVKKSFITQECQEKKPKNIKRIVKKARPEEKKIEEEPAVKDNIIHIIEKPAAETPEIRALDQYTCRAPGTNYFIIICAVSIIIFLVAGFLFPSTEEDIVNNRVIWAKDGKYDQGLFYQFYTAVAFTSGVFILGYYINSTFIKFNIRNWRFFVAGITAMFVFGLGKIGELIYNYEMFDVLKDFALPIALIIMAYSSYRIYTDLNGVI